MPVLKYGLTLIFIHASVCLACGVACCQPPISIETLSERYQIEHQNVLLYKTVNWWYDCLPQDDALLCGRNIRCTNHGNVHIDQIDQSPSVLKMSIQGGLADQLSVLRTCVTCPGPSFLRCLWQNEKYLGKGRANSTDRLDQFCFRHIDPTHAQMLKEIEKDIVFIVQGQISGLTRQGKIALYASGRFLKSCPKDLPEKTNHSDPILVTIKVTIKRGSTDEIIAQYSAAWPK